MSVLKFPRINTITLSGRLTREPEIRYTTNNLMTCSLSLAFDRISKDEYGNFQAKANFIDATGFGKTAETISEKCHKGTPVIIEGTLTINTFTDKNGVNRKNADVIINKIHILEKDPNEKDEYQHTEQKKQNKPDQANYPSGEDDVPF